MIDIVIKTYADKGVRAHKKTEFEKFSGSVREAIETDKNLKIAAARITLVSVEATVETGQDALIEVLAHKGVEAKQLVQAVRGAAISAGLNTVVTVTTAKYLAV